MDKNEKIKYEVEEKLEIIKTMLVESEKKFFDNGVFYITIGLFFSLYSIIYYFLIKYNLLSIIQIINYLPLMIILLYLGLYIFFKIKDNKGKYQNNKNIILKFISYLWVINSISFLLIFLLFFSLNKTFNLKFYFGILSIYLGTNFLLNGFLFKNGNILKISGVFWYFILIFFILIKESFEIYLYFGLFLFLFQVLPGLILFLKNKKING